MSASLVNTTPSICKLNKCGKYNANQHKCNTITEEYLKSTLKKLADQDVIREKTHYYVESGMPVCVNLSRNSKGHAVVCIGHKGISTEQMLDTLTCYSKTYFTSTASGCGSLIVMDDNSCPYSEYVLSDNDENPYSLKVKRNYKREEGVTFSQIKELEWSIDCFIAPLHKRMNMNAARAEQVILELIKQLYVTKKILCPQTAV